MRAKGYEIRGETFEEGAAKHISFRHLDKERFVRGSANPFFARKNMRHFAFMYKKIIENRRDYL